MVVVVVAVLSAATSPCNPSTLTLAALQESYGNETAVIHVDVIDCEVPLYILLPKLAVAGFE